MATYDQVLQSATKLREEIVILIKSFEDETSFKVVNIEIKLSGLCVMVSRNSDHFHNSVLYALSSPSSAEGFSQAGELLKMIDPPVPKGYDVAIEKIQAEMDKDATCGVLHEFEDE